ncbi:DUF6443 domain-containing protein, partial [Chitinophaga sp. sic0106]|uniref:DUF6443 domain-containing protein n=1 Tax=Chitinophaga sp. sic0106 TaxID=2854785 RepID=UPI002102D66D
MRYFILLISLLFVQVVNAQNVPVQPGVPAANPTALPSAYIAGPVNYIRRWTANMITTDGEVVSAGSRTPAEVQQTTQYFDGLGRPVQTVVKGISPAGRDLVTPVVYDSYGRVQFEYLPYTQLYGNTSDGLFKSQPFTVQQSFYQDTANYAGSSIQSIFYSQQAYEASPLNRVLKTWAPGNGWSVAGGGHPVAKQYLTNTLADSVVNWQQPASGLPLFNGVYNTGELLKDVTIDENGAQVVVFTDKENHVLLRKVQVDGAPAPGHGGWLCTYYVYDIRGNLRFVMPPKAVALMGNTWNPATVAAGLCFQYRFDGRDRLVVKKLPDADSLEMVYDNRDRLAFSRDGSQKQAGVWMATFYDDINRPVMTGIYISSNSRETLQAAMNSAAGSQTFTNSVPAPDVLTVAHHDGRNQYIGRQAVVIEDGFDTGTSETEIVADAGAITTSVTSTVTNTLPGITSADITPLTYTWYGAYDFPGAITFQSADTGKLSAGLNPYALRGVAPSTKTKGLVTGTRTKILGTADGWITSTIYYDDKGRQIQTCSNNITGGVDAVSNLYDFSGKLLATYHRQTNLLSGTTPQFTALTTMHYDHAGRLDEIKQKVNDQDSLVRTIVASTFDELGRVKSRRIGVKPAGGQMETQQNTYNLAGWQTSVNANYVNNGGSTGNWFGEVLSYDTGFTQS